jgi:hypothetical protein
MSLCRSTVLLMLLGAFSGSTAVAQQTITQPSSVRPTALSYYDSYYAQGDEDEASAEAASPSDAAAAAVPDEPSVTASAAGDASASGDACGGSGCDECDSGCGCCNLGDPWTLMGHFHGDCEPAVKIGGWTQWGYYDETNGLFNQFPHKFNNAQSWVYVEKETDTSDGGWDWGFRFDAVFGTDAQWTQAYGNPPGSWDYLNGYDHGIYGWALPQLYGDLAYGDLKIRLGHFFTTVGYEVVPATGNFFFSHSMTLFFSEPFTHTGVLGSYDLSEDTTVYGGWTLGWDSGFDQLDQGSSFLGGVAMPLVGDTTFSYMATGGNLGWRGRDAYTHSLVFDVPITEKLEYVGQSDYVRANSTQEETIGINQYLFWTYNDCVKLGTRVEWWKGDGLSGHDYGGKLSNLPPGSHSYYEVTFGANLIPHPNLRFRPEIRYDWAPFGGYSQSIFAIDVIATF